jgi:hypothetical protein
MCLSTELTGLHHVDERRLELESISPTLTSSPVQMLAVVGAENSQRVLLAMASNFGVKLLLIWLSSDSKARTFLKFSSSSLQ